MCARLGELGAIYGLAGLLGWCSCYWSNCSTHQHSDSNTQHERQRQHVSSVYISHFTGP